MAENPNYVCPLCKYADNSPTAYPCSSCPRIHPMEDRFEPNDEGVKAPGNCKFTVTVPEMTVLGVIEVIPCTEAAVKSINEVPEWRR